MAPRAGIAFVSTLLLLAIAWALHLALLPPQPAPPPVVVVQVPAPAPPPPSGDVGNLFEEGGQGLADLPVSADGFLSALETSFGTLREVGVGVARAVGEAAGAAGTHPEEGPPIEGGEPSPTLEESSP